MRGGIRRDYRTERYIQVHTGTFVSVRYVSPYLAYRVSRYPLVAILPLLTGFLLTMVAFLLLFVILRASNAFQLRSSSIVPTNKETLHNYLATPTHWPAIVLTSHSVKSVSKNRIDIPLQVGGYVEEVFGLPPLFPLSVVWQCVVSDMKTGKLEFCSEDGVPGLARQCKMSFDIREISSTRCNVDLVMEFEPLNPIVAFGVPLLSIDNNLSLKVLLPRAIAKEI